MSLNFRAERTACTMCYSTDPTNNLGLGMDTAAAIQALVGIITENVNGYRRWMEHDIDFDNSI